MVIDACSSVHDVDPPDDISGAVDNRVGILRTNIFRVERTGAEGTSRRRLHIGVDLDHVPHRLCVGGERGRRPTARSARRCRERWRRIGYGCWLAVLDGAHGECGGSTNCPGTRDGRPCPLRSIRLPALLGRSREPRALRFGGLTRCLRFQPQPLGFCGVVRRPYGFLPQRPSSSASSWPSVPRPRPSCGLLGSLAASSLGFLRASVSLSSASSEAARSVSSSAILSSSPPHAARRCGYQDDAKKNGQREPSLHDYSSSTG